MPVTVAEFEKTTVCVVADVPAANEPFTLIFRAVCGCVAESVKSPAGITICVDVPVRLAVKANEPVEFD